MNILHLVDATFQDKPGGSRKYAQEVALCMVEAGHSITFLAPKSRPEQPKCEVWNGLKIHRYHGSNPAARQLALRQSFLALNSDYRFDAAVVHFAYTALAFHVTQQNTPTLRVFHGPWDMENAAEFGIKGIQRKVVLRIMHNIENFSLQRSDRIICLSEFMAQDVTERFLIPAEKVQIIPGGVNLKQFCPGNRAEARKKLGLSEDAFVVCTTRRLAKRMGIELLIEAAATARKDIPDLQIRIAGRGPLQKDLQDRIDNLQLQDCVKLLGFVPDEELKDHYCSADLFVLPTTSLEGFGLVILEALACDTPVLGSPVGAIPDVLGKFDRELILPGCSADAVSEGIVKFYRSPERRARKYRSAIEASYSWQHVSEELLEQIAILLRK